MWLLFGLEACQIDRQVGSVLVSLCRILGDSLGDDAVELARLTGTAIDNAARVKVGRSEAEIAVAEYVVENYFAVLGLRPSLGRLITEREHDVAVVSWSFWHSRLGGDPGVLGKRILVDDALCS